MRSLDLRLLAVFDAILREKSVTVAGESLGLSQPVMSQSLSRLRDYFGDQLFVRTSEGMMPTPRALSLASSVGEVLGIVSQRFEPPQAFDPCTSSRTFSFFATDFAAAILVPSLMARFRPHSPNLRVRALPMRPKGMDEALESGEVDLAFGNLSEFGTGFYQTGIYHSDYVCLARGDHPEIRRALTVQQYLSASHALISPLPPGYDGLEKFLRDMLDPARIVLCLPNFFTVLTFLPQSDMLVTMPRRAGTTAARIIGAQVLELPVKIPGFDVKLFWHERFHKDLANQWFRNQVREAFNDR
ncbi:LysR family transcriptional regulator [Pigmentiphaga sp.]|uniref:LysR family transcriptional regulator n=1 Tax=Pigmentiphaga sp. TaxID=1977564 RepID=UPI00128D1704|nr:LysR family transcriptional regulator [Pigmentiphaga sp.]MPS30060.1 LysR family transcriptional regulator [Alcaligenaceae bacterium SAGV5]MPS51832.1 LysR family transcriptional regulator [Alcaligenaceae bacterium SAGV3]MPT56023.1 LysR family transcriptional regulator [Alcaligenaceae bacterium]